jgi:hypothetical protein
MPGHKEWFHFCVAHEQVDVIVNFGVSDDRRGAHEQAHLVVLVRVDGRWSGAVARFDHDDFYVEGGGIAARFGDNELTFDGQAFRVRAAVGDPELAIDLRLSPECIPSLSNNIRLAGSSALNWLVVPRLRASGTVEGRGRARRLDDAPAYHDHNWGYFRWGDDFSWEWGFGAPHDVGCPWSFVFSRLSNRAMTTTLTRSLTVWRGAQPVRSFCADEVRIETRGLLRPERIVRVPPVMGLLAPGTATEVPRSMNLVCECGDDRLDIVLDAEDVAQILVPDDDAPTITTINEVVAHLRVRGRICGEHVEYDGRGIFEVLV